MIKKLGYDKHVQLEHNAKRLCGLWLVFIGGVIVLATVIGGPFVLNPFIFMIGYGVGIYLTDFNKWVQQKFTDGDLSKFQLKMSKYGVMSLFPLMFMLGGPFIPSGDWRMVWLGTFLATGIHFFPFYYVHGKSMIYLAIVCSVLAIVGMFMKEIPFIYFGIMDGGVKTIFGIYLLFFTNRVTSNNSQNKNAFKLNRSV
ncbi:hypothetical protein EJF36_20765 [Bacillus sp. HMF5848]|uniref:DUF6609 family protein n=1 Tax=Bacillus sp. HMF5848 TaxID=2495421 RepID=UPI000F78E09B|nr:DUF6609 family protein [Bacillus sp. HMF5848]RSK29117.1 hypothetical protein EJF36_20765 [Bacillus sp. HMF5848]